jgi:hypothetical protein
MMDHRLKIRKLDAVDLVKGIFKLYLASPGYYIKLILIFLSALIFLEQFFLKNLIIFIVGATDPETGALTASPDLIINASVFVIVVLAFAIMVPINMAAMIALTRRLILRSEVTYSSILKEIRPKIPGCVLVFLTYLAINLTLFALVILISSSNIIQGQELFLSLLIIPIGIFIYLIPKFLFVVHSYFFEDSSVKDAIKESFRLTNGYWFRTALFWMLVNFLFFIGELIGHIGERLMIILLSFFEPEFEPTTYTIQVIFSSLWMTLILILIIPIRIIGSILMYFDLRARKDGFTNEDLAKSLNPSETAIPAELIT